MSKISFVLLPCVAMLVAGGPAVAKDFAFFEILKDGKATKAQIAEHCNGDDGRVRAFSAASLDLTLTATPAERVRYKDQQVTNVNANPGEWSGEVYKPLCPGLYTFTLSYTAAAKNGGTAGDIQVQVYLWRAGGTLARPGELVAVADKTGGPRGTGHAAITLAVGTGDEIATHARSADGKPRHFERIQITGYRVQHMPELAADFDTAAWEAARAETDQLRVLSTATK
jgi:hypothetical protein